MRGSRTTPRPAPPCEGGVAHALRSKPWGFWAGLCAACALAFSVLAEASNRTALLRFGELPFWVALLFVVCVFGRSPAAKKAVSPADIAASALYSVAGGALLSGLAVCGSVFTTLPMLVDIPGFESGDGIVASITMFQFTLSIAAAVVLLGACRIAGCGVRPLSPSGAAKLVGLVFASAVLYTFAADLLSFSEGASRLVASVLLGMANMTVLFLSCVLAVRRGWIPLVDGPSAFRCRPPARCAAFAGLIAGVALPAALLVPVLEFPFGFGVLSNFAYVGQGVQAGEYASEEAAREALLWAFPHNAPALGVEAAAAALAAALSLALAASALPAGSRAGALRRMPRALLAAAACVVFYEGAGLALYRVALVFGDGEAIMAALAVFRAAALPLALASAALLAARAASGARGPAPAEGVEGAVGDARE